MVGISIAIIGAFLLLLGGFIVKDIVVAKRAANKYVHYTVRGTVTSYLMLLPALLLLCVFVFLPIVYSLGYAFTDYYLLRPGDMKFVGFDNFVQIFKNFSMHGNVYNATMNTLKFVVFVVPLQIGMALGLALLVNKPIRGMGVYKVFYFAPVVISLTVTSFLWVRILGGGDTGLLNSFLVQLGMDPVSFLYDPQGSMYWIIFISAWQGCGYQMLIFLSGLKGIDQTLYEAAELDGASKGRQFLAVTLPGIRSVLTFVIVTVFIGACKIMVQPMLMTGEQSFTITLNYLMYIEGYTYRWVGYSSAIALLMTIVIGAITFVQRYLLKEED
ncbi:MAG: sugar ABC transporter permease [Clostridia bacterium]|nr:sugar ABC transporter permease [Clostridia bacterium]